MFERFTEKARRAVFFARYEASEIGSPKIEAEFLLLGLLQECGDETFTTMYAPRLKPEALRALVHERYSGEKISTAVDMPLSEECRDAFEQAVEEADRLGSQHITEEHLLLGLMHKHDSRAAELLLQGGADPVAIRQHLTKRP